LVAGIDGARVNGLCPYPLTGGAFLRDMLGYLDCQAQTLGGVGYQALAAPGSIASVALASLLTICIAVFGLRMILGHTPDAREGVMTVVKIGIVLTLATSWLAFRTLVYDVVVDGPAQIVGAIGGAAALPGSAGGMADRLQNIDDLLLSFVRIGSGQPLLATLTDFSAVDQARIAAQPVSDATALGIARTVYLTSIIGPLAIVRLGAGFLLAIAPLFAGLLLFDGTRGWFYGWLRALFAISLGAAVLAILFGAEVAVVEPWLADVLARRAANAATPAAPGEVLAMTLSFGVAAFGLLALMARLAFTVHLPTAWWAWAETLTAIRGTTRREQPGETSMQTRTSNSTEASRAMVIADAVARSDRREASTAATGSVATAGGRSAAVPAGGASSVGTVSAPVGQQFRRARPRISASARRRDR
jgi:type IV secretion system protein VirB6